MITVYPQPNIEITTKNDEWWLAFDNITKKIFFSPRQLNGFTPGILTLVVADTKEELDQYITENNLIHPNFDLQSFV